MQPASNLGWLSRRGFSFVANLIDAGIEGTRDLLGRITTAAGGAVALTLSFELPTMDTSFSIDKRMVSGWSGRPIVPKGVTVRVRQGVASFAGTVDDNGRVTLTVGKNDGSGKICLDLENDKFQLIEHILTSTVCIADLPNLSADTELVVVDTHQYLDVLLQLIDAHDYVEQVLDYSDMRKISVLVGDWARLASPMGSGYVGCMGMRPNLSMSLALETAFGLQVAQWPEFLLAVDMVIPPNADDWRIVAAHEYGHALTCSLLLDQSEVDFHRTWPHVVTAVMSPWSAANTTAFTIEAFADFISAQVVGGVAYVQVTSPVEVWAGAYCMGDELPCLEENINEEQFGTGSDHNDFLGHLGRAATLLHDAFDGQSDEGAPNDGAHWAEMPNGIDYLEGPPTHLGDEEIALPGRAVVELFSKWHSTASAMKQVTERSLFGALAQVMRDYDYNDSQICQLFALHSAHGTCPDYVTADFSDRLPMWGSLGNTVDRSGQSRFSAPATEPSFLAEYSLDAGALMSPPVVGPDAIVYIGAEDGRLLAVEPGGIVRWSFQTNGPIYGSPSIDRDGTIYVGSWDRHVYAVASDGTEKWSFRSNGAVLAAPLLGQDGKIYAASYDGNLYAIDRETGVEHWRFTVGAPMRASPALSPDGSIIIGTGDAWNSDGRVLALTRDGGLKWSVQSSASYIYASPAVALDGTAYVADGNGQMLAVAADGEVLWTYQLSSAVSYSSPAIGADGALYVGTEGGSVHSLDLADGTQRWVRLVDAPVRSSPAVSVDGMVFVASIAGEVVAFSTTTRPAGERQWDYQLSGGIDLNASLAIGKNALYLGSRSGVLHVLASSAPTLDLPSSAAPAESEGDVEEKTGGDTCSACEPDAVHEK